MISTDTSISKGEKQEEKNMLGPVKTLTITREKS